MPLRYQPSWFSTLMKGICLGACVSVGIIIALAIAML
jgi:hypothetical protein